MPNGPRYQVTNKSGVLRMIRADNVQIARLGYIGVLQLVA
jgi:hypothetical protein